jgi:hypothetical protein
MFTDDFDNNTPQAVRITGTHVVNQLIELEGRTLRYRIGDARVEGKLDGIVYMDTMFGDLEVLSADTPVSPPAMYLPSPQDLPSREQWH